MNILFVIYALFELVTFNLSLVNLFETLRSIMCERHNW
jgi:hypothetical protein